MANVNIYYAPIVIRDKADLDNYNIDVSAMTPKAGGTCTITFTEGDMNAEIVFS